MQFSVKLKGSKEFVKKLKQAHGNMDNMLPVYKSLGLVVIRRIQRHYKEGGPRHDRWVSLAASTIASRRKQSDRPLWDTGKLLLEGWEDFPETDRVTIAHKSDIAGYHEFGTTPRTIVPRNAKALRFMGEDGKYVYRKKVKHPGLPRRRQRPTQREIKGELIDTVDAWLKKDVIGHFE